MKNLEDYLSVLQGSDFDKLPAGLPADAKALAAFCAAATMLFRDYSGAIDSLDSRLKKVEEKLNQ